MSSPTVAVCRFGDFLLNRNLGGLFRLDEHGDRTRLALSSRALDVLCVLVEQHGTLVSKQTIMDAVWPDTAVEENNLTVHISALRRALDMEGTDGSCIQTVPGRGYRFIVPVVREEGPTRLDVGHSAAAPMTAGITQNSVERLLAHNTRESLPKLNRPSIAVLAFTNMSGDPEQEYFSDGVTEDIITELSRCRSLFVIARNSSFTYKDHAADLKQVARELGVRYVVEGSVRRSGVRVRITAQLIDAETANHIWAERYDRDVDDFFTVQDEISTAVVKAIQPAVADAEMQRVLRKPPENLGAWEAYQRGLWHIWRNTSDNDLDLGGEFFRQALALDPLFADAHAMLARYYVAGSLAGSDRPHIDRLLRAESEARAALRLDPNNAVAYSSLALIITNRHGTAHALEYAERAIFLNANDPSGYFVKGHILVFEHRADEARLALNTALELDPRGRIAVGVAHHLAVNFFLEGNLNLPSRQGAGSSLIIPIGREPTHT